ncbi:hypothetical protein HN51_009463 [Arachis hypogaea]|nr:LRR receptor-like serine/threonine-protein kinase [Arachis hypogaea]
MRRKEYSSNSTAVAVVVVVLLIITEFGGSYACIQLEREALLNFKRSLSFFDETPLLPSWEVDGDCCEWQGIACNNVTGHIVMLDLNDLCSPFIVESIIEQPSSYSDDCPHLAYTFTDVTLYLSQLQHLIYLNLSGVVIQGALAFLGFMQSLRSLSLRGDYVYQPLTIPSSSIENLANLRALYLQRLTLTNVTDSSWLSSLSSLQYLGLYDVDLSMAEAHHLFKVLNTLPSLLELHLSGCRLGQVSSSLVSDHIFPLTNLTRLQLLNLAWNDLSQNSPILNAFQNTTSIKVLDISQNLLSSVPPWLAKLHNLLKLDLSSTDITFLDPLRNLTSIKYLLLSHNKNLASLPLWFSHFDNLQVLSLGGCGFSGQLPSTLQNLTSIRVLNLNENNLNSITPLWWGNFKNLVFLSLSSNLFYGPVPYALRNLTHLTYLSLSNNNLKSLPSWLGELKSLVHLDLSMNNFTTVEEGFLSSILNNLCQLKEFNLSQSNFQGFAFKNKGTLSGCNSYALEYLNLNDNEFDGLLPNWLEQFKNLKYLHLMSNSFSGPIPLFIGDLAKLSELDLGDNMLNGSIPRSLGKLVNLRNLNLSSNNFSGVIPQSLGQLKNLRWLDLSSNHFCGVVSQSLSQLKNLHWLDLSSNHFIGVVPESLGQLKNLKWLDLSSNYLHGTINGLINSWPQLISLFHFDLSNNKIIGSIPENLHVIMPFLRSLILRNNLLNGSLPSSLDKLKYLYSFDVSNNKLSGKIPSTLWNLSLGWLRLNNNSFQGKLPSSLTNMKELRLLDLGENRLSGFIPFWNGNELPDLQILRLRKNLLHGVIPSSLCQFVELQILDLAENHLVGPIPRCISNITRMTSANTLSFWEELNPWDNEDLKQVIKGRELDYIRNLKYVINLDLSNNFLSGSIPIGISSLRGLIGLNFSYNNLSGVIPEMIGDMRSLESLDLSHNHLCGTIPRGMIDLYSLSHLNLSYNNLSGPIPVENQFQTFNDPLSYTGNQYLCGAPLPKHCPGDGPHHVPNIENYEDEDRENDKLDKVLFYSITSIGFATGFWGIVGFLYFKKNWRYVCFGYVEKVADRIYVAVVLKVVKLKKMMQRK